jgi:hypothetical protein
MPEQYQTTLQGFSGTKFLRLLFAALHIAWIEQKRDPSSSQSSLLKFTSPSGRAETDHVQDVFWVLPDSSTAKSHKRMTTVLVPVHFFFKLRRLLHESCCTWALSTFEQL